MEMRGKTLKLDYSDEFIESIGKQFEELRSSEKYKKISFFGEQIHPEQERFHHKSTISNISRDIHYGKLILENIPAKLTEKEMESILEMDKEAIIKEIEGYQNNHFTFIECLIGRKLSISEILYFEYLRSMSCIINPLPYKPLFITEGYSTTSLLKSAMRTIMDEFVPLVGCCSPVFITGMSRNLRLYDYERINDHFTINKFIEELKSSKQWYKISLIKNKSEDLQPYKNIVYPWDDDKSINEIHHRMEIKVEGDNRYGVYSKSGRNGRKRCKVVSK